MTMDAPIMAIGRLGWPKELRHHSDQGSQYFSEPLQRLMADNGVTCSMSQSGNVWDITAVESFPIAQHRTGEAPGLSDPQSGLRRRLRLHCAPPEPDASALDHRISKPYATREENQESLNYRPRRGQRLKTPIWRSALLV